MKLFKRRARATLIVITFSSASSLSAQHNSIEIEVPLIVNKAFSGNINAAITHSSNKSDTSSDVKLSSTRLQDLLDEFANQEQLEAWFGMNNQETDQSKQEVSLSSLRERGLEIQFDQSLLTIKALVPRLGTQVLSLRGNRQPLPQDHYAQSKIASGLNFLIRNTYDHDPAIGNQSGFRNTSIDFTGFTSIGGFGGASLFYEGSYLENDDKEFARQDVSLIHDNFDTGVRYSLGDIRPSVSAFQTSPSMLGVSVERNYRDINPFRNLSPSGLSTFTLDRAARVSFEINGVIVDTKFLEPGSYSINDFPLISGANDVRILLDEGTSRTEIANFSTYVDLSLLNPGISNFGLSAGVQRRIGLGRSRRYEDEPAILGFYEKGINQRLTLGAQAEAMQDHALLATSAIYGTRRGLVAIETAVSKRSGHNLGYSTILRYDQGFETHSGWIVQNDLQTRFRSRNFISLTSDVAAPQEWSFDARTSFRKEDLGFSVGVNVRKRDGEQTERYFANIIKSYKSVSLSLGYQYSRDNRSVDSSNHNISFNITKSFGGSRARAGIRSRNEEVALEWSNNSSQDVGSYQTRVNTLSDVQVNSAGLQVGYIGSRFEFTGNHITSKSKLNDAFDSSLTSTTLSGAVAYADGNVAFGRPFRQGFMIVEPHQNIRGKKVFVNRNNDETVTTAKRLRTTLVPLTSSYRPQRYQFEIDNLPLGYDIGSGDIRLYPSYLSGYRYTLGSDAANTVIGKLLWPDTSPVSLLAGKMIPVDGGDELSVFTNKTGRFVAEKAIFGDYQLVFKDEDHNSHTAAISVTESDEPGLVQVGTVTLERQQ